MLSVDFSEEFDYGIFVPAADTPDKHQRLIEELLRSHETLLLHYDKPADLILLYIIFKIFNN